LATRVHSPCRVRTIHMLTRTGAAPIAAGDLAPAMAKTDMATPLQTAQTKSLIPGFAQVLESSIGTAMQTGGSHTSKFAAPTKPRNAASSEPASTSINWTSTQPQQPVAPPQPQVAYALVPSAFTAPTPVSTSNSEAPSDPADPTSFAAVAASVEVASGSEVPELQSAQILTPSFGTSTITTSTASSALASVPQQSLPSSLVGNSPLAAATQTVQSPTSTLPTGQIVSPASSNSNGLASAVSVLTTTASSDTTMPIAASATAQQTAPVQQDSTEQSATANVMETALPATNSVPASVSGLPFSAPSAPISASQGTQVATAASSTAPDAANAMRIPQQTSLFPNVTGSPLKTSQSAASNASNASASPNVAQNQQQAAASNEAAAPRTSDDSSTPDSTTSDSTATDSQPTFPFVSSTISFSDAVTSDPTVSAQLPAASSATTATTPTPTLAIPVTDTTSSQPAAIASTSTNKGAQAQAPAAGLPSSVSGVKGSKSETFPTGTGWATSTAQTAPVAIFSSASDSNARQQKYSAGNSSVKTKPDLATTAPTVAPHPVPIPDAPTATSSKTQNAASPTFLNTPLTSDTVWSIPTLFGNTTTLTSLKSDAANPGTDDSATPNLADKTTSDSSATSDQSSNPGTDDNSRPTTFQTTASAVSSDLFAPVSVASNVSASTQTVSVAAALKQDPSSLAATGASTSHGDASGDAQLPSALVMHRAAEAAELSAGLQAWNGGDNAQTRMVQSARLAGNLGASEMNVSLRTEGLGAVELRTHVTGDTVGASISVERHDAHAMLTNDLGSLHQALNDRQLRVGDVKLFQGAFGADAAAADSQSSQRRDMAPQQQQNPNWMSGSSLSSSGTAATADKSDANIFFDSNGRLSVRA